MGITWGYIRVSTDDQGAGLAAQKAAVLASGVDERHLAVDDGVSGTKFDRPALNRLLAEARTGDVIVIHKMDRLGRSVRGVLNLIENIRALNVELRFLHENIDTTTPHGKFFFVVMLGLAEMERDMISARTKSALAEIKRTGIGKRGLPVKIGRKPKLAEEQIEQVRSQVAEGKHVAKVARAFGVSRQTVYNCLETVSK
jgi:DNA invertase Pin-like site-specific DNA recombinase